MIRSLSRWLIPDRDNVSSPAVRRAYGTLCGAVGIALNILLFIGKFFAGQLSGSIAVTADAFNNLSDAGSSAVTLPSGGQKAGHRPPLWPRPHRVHIRPDRSGPDPADGRGAGQVLL